MDHTKTYYRRESAFRRRSSTPRAWSDRRRSSVPRRPPDQRRSSVPRTPSDRRKSSVPKIPSDQRRSSVPKRPSDQRRSSVPKRSSDRRQSSVPRISFDRRRSSYRRRSSSPMRASDRRRSSTPRWQSDRRRSSSPRRQSTRGRSTERISAKKFSHPSPEDQESFSDSEEYDSDWDWDSEMDESEHTLSTTVKTNIQMEVDGLGLILIQNGPYIQISGLVEKSAAARDGKLQPGDTLLKIGHANVLGWTLRELRQLLHTTPIGTVLQIQVYRDFIKLPKRWEAAVNNIPERKGPEIDEVASCASEELWTSSESSEEVTGSDHISGAGDSDNKEDGGNDEEDDDEDVLLGGSYAVCFEKDEVSKRTASPLNKRGAPPLSKRRAPTHSKRGAPPLSKRGALPHSKRGSPPLSKKGAPPLSKRGAPPLSKRGAPPLSKRGAPPPSKRAPSPSKRGTPPPRIVHPQTFLNVKAVPSLSFEPSKQPKWISKDWHIFERKTYTFTVGSDIGCDIMIHQDFKAETDTEITSSYLSPSSSYWTIQNHDPRPTLSSTSSSTITDAFWLDNCSYELE